jgi:hypothetical protein
MTEHLWHDRTDPKVLLDCIRNRASNRKLRLFACACSRSVLHLVNKKATLTAIEFAERFADGLQTVKELHDSDWGRATDLHGPVLWSDWDAAVVSSGHASEIVAHQAARSDAANYADWNRRLEEARNEKNSISDAMTLADISAPPWFVAAREDARRSEQELQSHLARDIFGNPFRPVTLDPRWQSSTVLDLARTIYDERAFERMPILADALMDAGCDKEVIIKHCQGPGPHVRGCFLVDLILGKS